MDGSKKTNLCSNNVFTQLRILFCRCQGDAAAAMWRPRQVRPTAENQPEEEEIRRAGSEVGQVRGDLQVHSLHSIYVLCMW